ncbi:hypothetical protein OSTOST_19789, partial [Ostertagia ostertagi]
KSHEFRGARRALLLSLTLNIVVSFSGILAVSFFGTFLLQSIGFSEHAASLANCISGLSGTLGAILSTIAVDRLGRRVMVLGSLLFLCCHKHLNDVTSVLFQHHETIMGWLGISSAVRRVSICLQCRYWTNGLVSGRRTGSSRKPCKNAIHERRCTVSYRMNFVI